MQEYTHTLPFLIFIQNCCEEDLNSTHLWLANHTVRSANKPNHAQLPTTQTHQLLQIISRTQDCLELDSSFNILVGAQLMLYSTVFQADCKLPKNY